MAKIIEFIHKNAVFVLNGNSYFYKILRKIYHLLPNHMRVNNDFTYKIINDLSREKHDVFFIQIGSNDGVTKDPIYPIVMKEQWSGILVEPIKYVFDKLVENYSANKNVVFENVAISIDEKPKDFWHLKRTEDHLPFYYNQLGSFFPEVILKHIKSIPNIKKYLIKEEIQCISFESLVKKHAVEKIDLIHIDAEGYDFEIIKQIDFNKYFPELIIFEHKHLNAKDTSDCCNLLAAEGYHLIQENGNSIAVKITNRRSKLFINDR